MEVLLPGKENRKKWSMDGITYYYKLGKLYQCMSHRPRLVEGKKKDGTLLVPTRSQLKSREVFKTMHRLKCYYFKKLKDLPVWDVAPGDVGQSRLAKFHRANAAACDERGVMDYTAFKFSVGSLFQPMNARVNREGWTITVTWENREDRASSRASDELRVGYFYDSYPLSPRLFPEVVAKRKDCRAVFTIQNEGLPGTESLHLYLFFARRDGTAFSPNLYWRV